MKSLVAPAAMSAPRPPADTETDSTADDRFHMIALIFQRARQLQNGARPRVHQDGHKPNRLAQLEVMAGLISWEILPDPGAASAAKEDP